MKEKVKVLILSRGRSDSITTHKLMPFAELLVPESEVELYEHCGLVTHTIPDSYIGLGAVRNYVLDNFDNDCVIMVDDDIRYLLYLMDKNPVAVHDSDIVYQLLINSYVMCKDAGIKFFSYNQKCDVRKTNPSKPYLLNTWGGCVIGIIGKDIRFCKNKFKVDIDFTLQQLLENRIVLIDDRYGFLQVRDRNKGGNSIFRTQAEVDVEIDYLRGKWGKHINITKTKSTYNIKLNVDR